MKHAFLAARGEKTGVNLGLPLEIFWQGYSGLSLTAVKRKVASISNVTEGPSIILLHCGGNDLGRFPLKSLRQLIVEIFQLCLKLFPKVALVWSEILPRVNYRHSNNVLAMERSRRRLNSYAGKLAIRFGGAYLRHEYMTVPANYLTSDGVHLSKEGNCLFLQQVKKAITQVLRGDKYVC